MHVRGKKTRIEERGLERMEEKAGRDRHTEPGQGYRDQETRKRSHKTWKKIY